MAPPSIRLFENQRHLHDGKPLDKGSQERDVIGILIKIETRILRYRIMMVDFKKTGNRISHVYPSDLQIRKTKYLGAQALKSFNNFTNS
jgi:hypothetical protein